jgi:hypothetical protein
MFLREPGCVICSKTVNPNSSKSGGECSADLYVNLRLKQDGLVPMRGEPTGSQIAGLTYIGHYDDLNLYTNNTEHFH